MAGKQGKVAARYLPSDYCYPLGERVRAMAGASGWSVARLVIME